MEIKQKLNLHCWGIAANSSSHVHENKAIIGKNILPTSRESHLDYHVHKGELKQDLYKLCPAVTAEYTPWLTAESTISLEFKAKYWSTSRMKWQKGRMNESTGKLVMHNSKRNNSLNHRSTRGKEQMARGKMAAIKIITENFPFLWREAPAQI